MTFSKSYMDELIQIASEIPTEKIENLAKLLSDLRNSNGRLFVLGVGGSAANSSHAVNDFRKLAGIETYSPTDNVAEITARTNDEGWSTVFEAWLKVSRLNETDCLLVLSVGGGDELKQVSTNLIGAIKYARSVGAKVTGIVGRNEGYTAQNADLCVVIPINNSTNITPHAESFQSIVWHLLVMHPLLKLNPTKW